MMIGILIGALCLMLLFSMSFRGRRRWADAHGHSHGGRCAPPREYFGPHGPPWARRHPDSTGEEDRGDPEGRQGERRRRRRRRGRVDFLRREAARRLNLDDHQQDVVEVAAKQADKAIKGFVEILGDSRDELADAVKGENLDQARLDAVFEKWDESMVEARKDLVDALRRAHAALEPDQRRRLAEWIGLAGWSR